MSEKWLQYKEKWKDTPIATAIIVVVTVVFFLYTNHVNPKLTGDWANDNERVLVQGEYYRLLTCMLLHANMSHLMGNMLLFGAMGSMLEKKIGTVWWTITYFGAGVLGALATDVVYLRQMEVHRSVGASVGAYGMVGMLLTLVLLHKGRYEGISVNRIIFVVLLMVYTSAGAGEIDHVAHVFGFLVGFLISFVPGIYMVKKENGYDNQRSN